MKRLTLLGGILSILLSFLFLSNRVATLNGEFKIDPTSQLRLEGETNINSFSCNCQEDFPRDTYEIDEDGHPYFLKLRNTDLKLPIRKLDCKRKGINNDLYKALQADSHPYIHIEIQSIRLPESKQKLSTEYWTDLPVQTHITIAGTRRPLHLQMKVKALGTHTYHLISESEIAMSDFGIDPPRPLLGMIKVKDLIRIHFDLKVEI